MTFTDQIRTAYKDDFDRCWVTFTDQIRTAYKDDFDRCSLKAKESKGENTKTRTEVKTMLALYKEKTTD